MSLDAKRKVERYVGTGISEGAKLVYRGSILAMENIDLATSSS